MTPDNPNLRRRSGPGLLAWLAVPALKPALRLLRKPARAEAPLTVFESYMVGDFFMALPALKALAAAREVRVVCRCDCLELLAREGIIGLPFANDFRVRPGLASFVSTLRSAWNLRGHLGPVTLDFDGDPRTAFWLKIAGAPRVVSYRRDFGVFFDETFPLPRDSVHQADRDMRVAEEFVKRNGRRETKGGSPSENPLVPGMKKMASSPPPPSSPWLLSVWTRKTAKNWPLVRWEGLLERLTRAGISFEILDAPDGDAEFRAFRERWRNRAPFAKGTLAEIADRVGASAGVIATDNFLGHMAGYLGKPVLWINLCSPAEQVEPRGPRTLGVAPDSPAGGLPVEKAWAAFEGLRAPQ